MAELEYALTRLLEALVELAYHSDSFILVLKCFCEDLYYRSSAGNRMIGVAEYLLSRWSFQGLEHPLSGRAIVEAEVLGDTLSLLDKLSQSATCTIPTEAREARRLHHLEWELARVGVMGVGIHGEQQRRRR
jgi:hypothetical protein